MPIDSVQRGQNTCPTFVLADPSNTSANANISQPASADAVLYSSIYGPLVGSFGLLLNASGLFDRQRSAPGTIGIPSINTEGTKATFSVALGGFTPDATPTDFWQIIATTKTVRVTRVSISGIASAATVVETSLVKRSTLNTGGVLVPISSTPHDANDAAVTAVVNKYTTTPSGVGTGVAIRAAKLNLGAATGGAVPLVWDFTTRNGQGIVLRSSTQSLCLNWGGVAVPGGSSLTIDVEWTEE